MNKSAQNLPEYLQRYCTEQDYARYTPREHATWRYIMRQAQVFFAEHAVPSYLEGLKKTGIPIEAIPHVNAIDECLKAFGWGAVGVTGFIPPAAFLDFQARGIMPIAMDMRSLEHVAYTPAPDIVHEAAGHVPILIDAAYRDYLKQYATMAKKAIISHDDIMLYEAIRYLSDIKENPDTKPEDIKIAEQRLCEATAAVKEVTELAQVARMNWWTAEYGLVGDLKNPKIYGAGLLSSVGESKHCLTDKVRKIRLSIDCIHQGYDITEPQPQLFVAESMEQLPEVLHELENSMAYKTGGEAGLRKAKQATSVNTVVLDSGVSASGILSDYITAGNTVEFIRFGGPVQLALHEIELAGHGRARHAEGFSSPIGYWQQRPEQPPQTFSDAQLAEQGIHKGGKAKLEFRSGFVVTGIVKDWHRHGGNLLYITWRDCSVRRGEQRYFEPAWGEFDMLVGAEVVSVFGGPADRAAYGHYELGKVSSSPGRQSPFTATEKELFELYARTRALREQQPVPTSELQKIAERAIQPQFKQDWLLALEIAEIAKQQRSLTPDLPWLKAIHQHLATTRQTADAVTVELVERGLALIEVPA